MAAHRLPFARATLAVLGASVLASCSGSNNLLQLNAALRVTPQPIVLPPTARGQSSSVEVQLDSIGNGALRLEGIAVEGSSDWTLELPPLPLSLAPGARAALTVTYRPTGEPAPALLVIRSDDFASPEMRVGILASPAGEPAAPPRLCADVQSLDFGAVQLGHVASHTVTLSACGGSAVVLSGMELSSSAFGASGSAAMPLKLEPGADALAVSVRFAPSAPGRVTGELRARSNAGDVVIPLAAEGHAAATAATLTCFNGQTGTSWRDLVPPRPPAASAPAVLPNASGTTAATCSGEPTVVTDPASTETVQSQVGHTAGRWYFEASVEQYTAGWSSVSVFASPADAFTALSPWGPLSAAGIYPSRVGVISVLADLDSGAVHFYADGVRFQSSTVALLPGIGAFHAGGVSMGGNEIRFNYGGEPFAFGVPPGWSAWASGPSTPGGACAGATAPTLPSAPIDVLCESGLPCTDATTFASGASGAPELIVLGTYDSGSVTSWEWGFDANGNPIPVTVGPGQDGAILVDIQRPGPIVLVLTAYEPTDWTVRLGPNTTLTSVSAYGMHVQTVTGVPAGVPVDLHSICTGGNGGNCPGTTGENFPVGALAWPFDTGGGETQAFIETVEKRFCLPLSYFAGAYDTRQFVVRP